MRTYLYRKVLTLATVTVVTVAGLSAPAEATPADEAGKTVTVGSCAELRAKRAALAARGAKKAVCAERGPVGPAPRTDGPPKAKPPSATAADCTPSTSNQWTVPNRKVACRESFWRLDVFLLPNGPIIAQVFYRETQQVVSSAGATWTHEYRLTRERAWGDLRGATITGTFSCRGACFVSGGGFFGPAPVAWTSSISTTGRFASTVTPGGVDTGFSEMQVVFGGPFLPSTFGDASPTFRCDAVIVPEGCVFPAVTPVFVVSFLFDGVREWASHVLRSSASTGYGRTQPLTRTTNPVINALNRAIACPDRFPRPPGKSCDEYPFASTLEGAIFNIDKGRTFDGCSLDGWLPLGTPNQGPGWSACMIDETQNSRAGGLQLAFYNRERVLDGDRFWIFIF